MPEERMIRRQSLSSIAIGGFYELIVSCVQMGAKKKAASMYRSYSYHMQNCPTQASASRHCQ